MIVLNWLQMQIFDKYGIIYFMIGLEWVNPGSQEHMDRYIAMLERASTSAEVRGHLPEIFEEGSISRVQEGIRANGALRYFVIIDGSDVGRAELTRHLNTDPSIVKRTPEGLALGYNTCYFITPDLVQSNYELAHQHVADACIRQSFVEGDQNEGLSPWLPVSLDGHDVSRGWLLQADSSWYDVHQTESQTGFFPQFGIGNDSYSLLYATPKVA